MPCHVPSASASATRRLPKPSMKLADAIAHYLERQQERGRVRSTLVMTDCGLRTFFRSMLTEQTSALTAAKMAELREALGRHISRRTESPFTDSTLKSYKCTARTFVRWCVQIGLAKSGTLAGVKHGGAR